VHSSALHSQIRGLVLKGFDQDLPEVIKQMDKKMTTPEDKELMAAFGM
jgi:hypothetical protein